MPPFPRWFTLAASRSDGMLIGRIVFPSGVPGWLHTARAERSNFRAVGIARVELSLAGAPFPQRAQYALWRMADRFLMHNEVGS